MIANQHGGRPSCSLAFPNAAAGVIYKESSDSGLSAYEPYNASIFSLYLPIANVADVSTLFRPQLHRCRFTIRCS
jgi:hypothetical protein